MTKAIDGIRLTKKQLAELNQQRLADALDEWDSNVPID